MGKRYLAGIFLFFIIKCNAQTAFIYQNDTLIKSADIKLSELIILEYFKEQKCYNSNSIINNIFIFSFQMDSTFEKEDFLLKKFMINLTPYYHFVKKKNIKKIIRDIRTDQNPSKVLTINGGYLYDECEKPLASIQMSRVYCSMFSEQYFKDFLKNTKQNNINFWFYIHDPKYGKFIGIIGIDNLNNLWVIHEKKGGFMSFGDFIQEYWDEWQKEKTDRSRYL
ncbi:MAG: hypothetical protein LBQ60_05895 [Bacteroidales bacterium]|jgi:hypothetical protein|nr:hypothetical protein [Bacteroidales bacterium]